MTEEEKAEYNTDLNKKQAEARDNEILECAAEILRDRMKKPGEKYNSPAAVAKYLSCRHVDASQRAEIFTVLYLNSKLELLHETHTLGTIDRASVYPREVVRAALDANAATVILAHNHPSGGTKPGKDDIGITKQIGKAMKLFGMNIADHVIYSPSGLYYSFVSEGETLL